jgi:D-alanyl-D-alanine carboxypeptidase
MGLRSWFACAAALATLVAATPVAYAATGPAHADAVRLDLDAIVAQGSTSALVELRDGARTVRLTSGSATYGTKDPVDPRGRFRVGSVTKLVVATAVLQLVAERRISLDDQVDRWLPGVLPPGNGIKVKYLLDHTSGLYDYTGTLPLNPPTNFLPLRWDTWAPQQLVDRATALGTLWAPHAGFKYSSTGYIVLGMLIERITGRPYGDEIARRILRPLGLRDTTFPGTDPRIHGPHADAYLPDGDGGVVDITEFNPSVQGAAGQMISSATDLNRFDAALFGGRLLPPTLLHQMKTPEFPSSTGLGVEFMSLTCGKAYGKTGDALGASAWTYALESGRTATMSVAWGTGRPTFDAVRQVFEDALCA